MGTSTTPFSYFTHLLVFLAILHGLAVPYCVVAMSILYSGDTLSAGQSLVHENYIFTIQRDCNLVLYDTGIQVWASDTAGLGRKCQLALLKDGDLVVYDDNIDIVWSSKSAQGDGNYVLVMQRDRNVVIYGSSIWATHTRLNVTQSTAVDALVKSSR